MDTRRKFLFELNALVQTVRGSAVLKRQSDSDIGNTGKISSLTKDQSISGLKRIVDVLEFGAIADGESHPLSEFYNTLDEARTVFPNAVSMNDEVDWCASDLAVQHCRSTVVGSFTGPNQGGAELHLSGHLRFNRTLFLGADRAASDRSSGHFIQKIIGSNCLIHSTAEGLPAIDLSGTRFTHIEDITLSGDSANTPSVGFLFGRTGEHNKSNSLRSSGLIYCLRLRTQGSFTQSAIYNYGSEGDRFEHCRFRVDGGSAKAVCILAASNELNIHSSVVHSSLVDPGSYKRQASNWPFFTDCDFIAKNTESLISAVLVYGGLRLRIHGGLIDTLASNSSGGTHISFYTDGDRNFAPRAIELQGILHHRAHENSYVFNCNVTGLSIINPTATGKNSKVKVKLVSGFRLKNVLMFFDEFDGDINEVAGMHYQSNS